MITIDNCNITERERRLAGMCLLMEQYVTTYEVVLSPEGLLGFSLSL
jgi:hypothetical protein